MLEFSSLNVHYGGLAALRDITLSFAPGERVGIFGHNGAGKTTLLRCAVGGVAGTAGGVSIDGKAVKPGAVYQNVMLGVGFVAQGHNVFSDLTVAQNLKIAGLQHDQAVSDEVFEHFPALKDRRAQPAGWMSGGEQQMLALGMSMMTQPRYLLLDEPATGLAPLIVSKMLSVLDGINRDKGAAIVIVEQNVPAALSIVDRAIVLKSGRIVFDGPSEALKSNESIWEWF